MELDKIIQVELDKRSHRLRALKKFGLNKEGVEYMSGMDVKWIQRECQEKGYNPQQYLQYYQGEE